MRKPSPLPEAAVDPFIEEPIEAALLSEAEEALAAGVKVKLEPLQHCPYRCWARSSKSVLVVLSADGVTQSIWWNTHHVAPTAVLAQLLAFGHELSRHADWGEWARAKGYSPTGDTYQVWEAVWQHAGAKRRVAQLDAVLSVVKSRSPSESAVKSKPSSKKPCTSAPVATKTAPATSSKPTPNKLDLF